LHIRRETISRLSRNLALCVIAGIVLIILAPFNTHSFTLLGRSVYWIGLCIAGGIGAAFFEIVTDLSKRESRPWQTVLASATGATLAVSLFVIVPNSNVGFSQIVLTLFYIFIVALVISVIGMLLRTRVETSDDSAGRPALYDRLPPKLRTARIYALGSEDHYVRVYTDKGEEMILMRLSDAIKEARPVKGLRTHRSWWVAEEGVETLKRAGGKTLLTLKSGASVPVSKSGYKEIKTEGWL